MELKNERTEQTVIYDVELSDSERDKLLKYAKEHITDDALIQFAILDSLENSIVAEENKRIEHEICSFCENLAELGCPADYDSDMWFRELSEYGRLEVVSQLKKIMKRNES